MDNLEFIKTKLLENYDELTVNNILSGYIKKYTSLRVNTLKSKIEEIEIILKESNISYSKISWYKDALVILNSDENTIRKLSIYDEGKIYLQNLSSMLPPLVVDPKEQESILDMTSAPGGKTAELACLSNNRVLLTAVEKNKIRCERLKYNLIKQGVNRVTVLNEDARRLDDLFRFDKILLDAPCSGSGTVILDKYNTYKNLNQSLINKSIQSQKELLKKASKIIKLNGEIIYSTCSILKEENEDIVNSVLQDGCFKIVPIDEELFQEVPKLPVNIKGTMCVCPSELYEGFYVAKIKRIR